MKKTLSIVLTVLGIALLTGANIVEHFASRKLGMVRWLNYNNQKLEGTLPIDLLFYLGLAFVIALVLFALRRLWANGDRRVLSIAGAVLTFAMTVLFAFGVFTVTCDVTPAYFLIKLLMGLAALLQATSLLIWSSTRTALR